MCIYLCIYINLSCVGFSSYLVDDSTCHDIIRTPYEYLIAFVVNVVLIVLPLVTFYAMCARELLPFAQDLVWRVEEKAPLKLISFLCSLIIHFLWLCVALVCAPFFILYVAGKQVKNFIRIDSFKEMLDTCIFPVDRFITSFVTAGRLGRISFVASFRNTNISGAFRGLQRLAWNLAVSSFYKSGFCPRISRASLKSAFGL